VSMKLAESEGRDIACVGSSVVSVQHCRGVRGRAMESMRVVIIPGIGI